VQDTVGVLIINDIRTRIVIGGLRCTREATTAIGCFNHDINVFRYLLLLSFHIVRASFLLLINNGNFLIIRTVLHIIQKFLEI
jgi:hypothetical protein